MRILGIDYGTKRHGLAISDPLGYTAQRVGVVARKSGDLGLEEILEVIADREVERIVVGLPFHMDGRPGDHHDEVLELVTALEERTGLPVETIDERLTTVQAERSLLLQGLSRKKRKERVDQVAAQLILQGWLDSRR